MIRIVVPDDNAALSPNRANGSHWRTTSRAKKSAKNRALIAWHAAGCPRVQGPFPVRVDITIRRGRVMDTDNALASLKAVIDGLFKGQCTPDDSSAFLALQTPKQETGRAWVGREEVEFVIFSCEHREK